MLVQWTIRGVHREPALTGVSFLAAAKVSRLRYIILVKSTLHSAQQLLTIPFESSILSLSGTVSTISMKKTFAMCTTIEDDGQRPGNTVTVAPLVILLHSAMAIRRHYIHIHAFVSP